MNAPSHKATILVVDDTPENIDVLVGILKPYYKVKIATNGEKALRLCLLSQPPDLILLDVMMPGMDGFEVCRCLKAEPTTENIPVIFVTAMHEINDEITGFEAGGVDYIHKPINPPIVLSRIKTHLRLCAAYHFMRETFGRYLSDEVVELIINTPNGLKIGGEKRNITILMADLRGFTMICNHLKPDQVIDILNIYLSRMTEVIQQYHGTIDEFIGDGILVTFGATIRKSDHAQRAVRCAIAMQQAMEELKQTFIQLDYPQVTMGVGIHTGEVVVGNIGSHRRAKYGVVGQVVNITSRIESCTVGGQVLISDAVAQACDDRLIQHRSFELCLKGLNQPLLVHDIISIQGEGLPNLQQAIAWTSLQPPILLELMIVRDKCISGNFEAQWVTKALPKIQLITEAPLTFHSNIKLMIPEHAQQEKKVVYAKVTDVHDDHLFTLHITSPFHP